MVTDEMLEPFLEGLSLTLALSDRRIFIVDYEILENCPTRPDIQICEPMALFFLRNDGSLVPIAIQLRQVPSDDNPVFLPTDPPYTWIMAKMWFNNADACVHQAITHLGFTHLVMEGIITVTHRQLSQSHPVFKLLAPHFLYLININARALEKIMGPSGWIEEIMAIGVAGFHELIRRYKAKWNLDIEGTLPMDLAQRGVDDPEILRQYHFRSDAVMLYEALRTYVSKYLRIYYDTDDKILADEEIQKWREEMVESEANGGLGILGIPGNSGKFISKPQLITVCTCLIYTCSVGHAATNFKQYDEYAFPPNYPTKLSGCPPRSKDPLTEDDVLAALPDKQTTLNTMIITKILSQKTGRSLGDFEVNYVYDPAAVQVVKEFREDLKRISSTIKTLNKSRNPPYPYLDPANVPNAVSV
jgi:arachidonate 5-lipoxygenase